MSRLKIYQESGMLVRETENPELISDLLSEIGLKFSRWAALKSLSEEAQADEILAAYTSEIEAIKQQYAFNSVDVVSLKAGGDISSVRNKFLAEHTHSDHEVRFFIEGQGLFCVHAQDRVYQILCKQNDFIFVPAQTKHWFDTGLQPDFRCIRFFTDEAGWIATYTGDDISSRFPALDDLIYSHG